MAEERKTGRVGKASLEKRRCAGIFYSDAVLTLMHWMLGKMRDR